MLRTKGLTRIAARDTIAQVALCWYLNRQMPLIDLEMAVDLFLLFPTISLATCRVD